MPDDNTILEMLQSGGEDHDNGPSATRACLQCARRYRLSNSQPDENPFAPHNEGRNVGTITHALVRAHHAGEDPELFVPRHSNNPDVEVLLNGPRKKGTGAWTMYEDYANRFPKGFWGEAVKLEEKLEANLFLGLAGPQHTVKRSGILDALWLMDEGAVQRVQNTFEIMLNGPGYYAWDLKTATSLDPDLAAKWGWDPQPTQYQWLCWEALQVETRGFLVFQAVGYKKRETAFQMVCLPPMDDTAQRRWENQVALGLANLEADDVCGNQHCYAYFRDCPHRVSGICDGV